jgi:predicted anti-sigma-YlaC factor YlaD
VIAELAAYLDDEVAAEVRADLETHLRECRTCRVLYDTSRKTLQIVTEVRSYEIPQPLSERLVGKIMRGLRAERAAGSDGAVAPGEEAASGRAAARRPGRGSRPTRKRSRRR